MEYTGYLKDVTQPGNKGAMFDSSAGREDLVVQIGVGRVIKGWDVAVLDMKLGERATLEMTSDYAYGEHGFGGHIPPRADLIFDACLKGIK
ncbi:hypothetical protein P8C59_006851 [Phyllachora maydis]|uniref:peptidylprolyl isomerase n=1 Tax=Phyllachora maydis TaxID=1825666 RepID=A0AAD9I784_9PEZI|nr:hypothetical protein P8C59_006851 [Phyllachora maydis]